MTIALSELANKQRPERIERPGRLSQTNLVVESYLIFFGRLFLFFFFICLSSCNKADGIAACLSSDIRARFPRVKQIRNER
jgi:hypothetical protein